MVVKITVSCGKQKRPRPKSPNVNLTAEAYDTLLALSDQHGVSMRKLASEIIMQASENLEVAKNEG